MKVKTLVCNCKGTSDSFRDLDMNTLPFEIESELDVDYAIVHPELCGQGGNAALEDILRSAADDPDTCIVVAGCALATQQKLFKKILRSSGLDAARFVPVDISEATNSEALERLRKKLQSLLHPEKKSH